MYSLNFDILTFFIIFYVYCFLGWCFESCYVSLKNKKWVNRGFINGPFLPIYGTGAVIILFSTVPVMRSPILVFIVSVVMATLLEFITGCVMERLFKVKYWDYSNNFLNYKGYICFKSSVAWGFMGMLVTYVINEPIAKIITSLSQVTATLFVCVVTIFFVVDFVESFKTAYNLREMILNNAKLMEELNEIKVQITEAIDNNKEKFSAKKEAIANDLKSKIDTALSYTEIDDMIIEKIDELRNLDIDETVEKWREKAGMLKESIEKIDVRKITILKRNPTAKSKFGFIKEIRIFAEKKKTDDK